MAMRPEHAAALDRAAAFKALPGWHEHYSLASYIERFTAFTPAHAGALLASAAVGAPVVLPPADAAWLAHSADGRNDADKLRATLASRYGLASQPSAPAAASQPPAPKPDPAAGWKAAFAKATERSAFTI